MKKTGKQWLQFGFRSRMRLTMILVIFWVMAFGACVSTYLHNREQTEALNRLGAYVAANLAQNSSLGVLSEEPEHVSQALEASLSDTQILGAHIYLANGDILDQKQQRKYSLADFDPGEHLGQMRQKEDGLPYFVKAQTTTGEEVVSFFEKVIIEKAMDDIFNLETAQETLGGFVRIDVSLAELEVHKITILYRNLLLMPLYVFIGILFSYLAERRISRPLLELKKAANSLAQGDFDAQIEVSSKDELGLLAKTFNYMGWQLSQTINELHLANESLEQANRELQDFTYIVSHDLQEPLRKVHSFGQFLVEDYQDLLPAEGQDYVGRMQNATVRMKELIQDLLKLSRIGTAEETFDKIDLNEVLRDVVDDLSIAIEKNEAEIVYDSLPDVRGNQTQLTQLLENLVSNALKYRSDERKPRVEIGFKEEDDSVSLWVKDNGIGIKEAYKDKVFGVFQRLHSSDEKYKGTGIGLALCKKIVQRHGGRIWIESTLGSGSIFYFTLLKVESGKGVSKV